jgi:hypothetical protein
MKSNPKKVSEGISKIVQKEGPGVTGYRNPHDIQYPKVLAFHRNTCPRTKHIVTIRHPLLWFESFYNYRNNGKGKWSIKDEPNKLMGRVCNRNPAYVCADNGAFHRYLVKLGKTPLDDPGELELLSEFKDEFVRHPPTFENPLFLVETSQLNDANATRDTQLRHDIQTYLGLKHPMPPIPHSNSMAAKLKAKPKRAAKAFNICDPQYEPIHSKMMQVAKDASLWIRNYFLKSSSVTVSSPNHFEELLESWLIDPYEMREHT